MWITDDIQIETSTTLTTTGGTVWDAARVAVSYLEEVATAIGLDRPGAHVLELGAGCGLLGLTCARNLPDAALVCLTEQATGGALAHLQRNVELNQWRLGPVLAAVHTAECDWNDYAGMPQAAANPQDKDFSLVPNAHDAVHSEGCSNVADRTAPCNQVSDASAGEDRASSCVAAASRSIGQTAATATGNASGCSRSLLASTPWDFIIGSDLVYNNAGAHVLPRVLRALSQPHTVAYYVHTKHRFDHLDMVFLEQLVEAGLEWEEVRAPSAPSPPPSPPPLTELFPDFRVAVFRIRRGRNISATEQQR